MSSRNGRRVRRLFDGTGAYIALFLVVTALAVAGYWSLIPHETAAAPVVDETPPIADPIVSAPRPAPAPTPQPAGTPDEPEPPEPVPPEPEPAAPVQSAVTLTLPEAETIAPPPEPQTLTVRPLTGEIVAAFSADALTYSETLGDWRTHDGVDLAAELGAPVCAAAAGTVLDVRDDDLMGSTVVISHDGGFDTLYANLEASPTVEIGDVVGAGQIIGSVGATALCESALPTHLHFGVTKDGEPVDPAAYLH